MKLATKIDRNFVPFKKVFKIANDDSMTSVGKLTLNIRFKNRIINHEVFVMDKLAVPCIIGRDIIGKYGIVPDVLQNFISKMILGTEFHFIE